MVCPRMGEGGGGRQPTEIRLSEAHMGWEIWLTAILESGGPGNEW